MRPSNLKTAKEPANLHNRYVVAVLKEETVVGHMPRKIKGFANVDV